MEIKQGDKVRVSKDIPMFYRRYNSYRVFEVEHQVVDIEDGLALLDSIPSKYVATIPTKYLVKVDAEAKEAKIKYRIGQKVKSVYCDEILTIKEHCGRVGNDNVYRVEEYAYTWNECELKPYTEPTEQTEAKETFEDQLRDVLNGVEHQDYGYPIQASMIGLDINDWDAYAADLAKEVVLKTVNSASDRRPSAIAEYATDIAKAVVEGLKGKLNIKVKAGLLTLLVILAIGGLIGFYCAICALLGAKWLLVFLSIFAVVCIYNVALGWLKDNKK